MDEESPNQNAREISERLELRRRQAEVEFYEEFVRGQKHRMDSDNKFHEDYQTERLRQARRFSNIAVILLIVDMLCVSAIIVFCFFIAVPYLHLPLLDVVKIVGAAVPIVATIFGISRWLYNKPNRFLEVAAGNLSPEDNETLSSKVLRSRSKDKQRLGKNTITTNATVLPDGLNSIDAGLPVSRRVGRQKNANNLRPNKSNASARPRCPICQQNRYVRRSITQNGYSVYICTRCNHTF